MRIQYLAQSGRDNVVQGLPPVLSVVFTDAEFRLVQGADELIGGELVVEVQATSVRRRGPRLRRKGLTALPRPAD